MQKVSHIQNTLMDTPIVVIGHYMALSHWHLKLIMHRASAKAQLASAGSHMGTGLCLPALLPIQLCLWTGKAVQDDPKSWNPGPAWKAQKKILATGFGVFQLWVL